MARCPGQGGDALPRIAYVYKNLCCSTLGHVRAAVAWASCQDTDRNVQGQRYHCSRPTLDGASDLSAGPPEGWAGKLPKRALHITPAK